MERDFLGVVGREASDEGSKKESVYFGGGGGGGPAMEWAFRSKAGGAPAVMSFKSAREEPKELVLDQFSASGFRHAPPPAGGAFDGVKKMASPVLTPQRSFGAESQGNPQYAVHGHRAPTLEPYGAPQHVLNGARMIPGSSPFSMNNPMFRVQSSPNLPNVAGGGAFRQPPFAVNNAVPGSTVGVYGTRDLLKSKTAQLTIFYAGSVNVFDNVSAEKAQELMFLASRGSLPSAANAGRKPDPPIFAPAKVAVPDVSPAKQMLLQKQEHLVPPVSGASSPISVVSQAVTLPRSASSSNTNSAGAKSADQLVVPPTSRPSLTQPALLTTTTTAAAAAIVPRAVPQARKASLARFLEKRKERVATVVPYPSSKSPLESSDTFGSTNDNSKSSCTDIALSSNRGESLCLGQPRNISFSEEPPSTKLQI